MAEVIRNSLEPGCKKGNNIDNLCQFYRKLLTTSGEESRWSGGLSKLQSYSIMFCFDLRYNAAFGNRITCQIFELFEFVNASLITF